MQSAELTGLYASAVARHDPEQGPLVSFGEFERRELASGEAEEARERERGDLMKTGLHAVTAKYAPRIARYASIERGLRTLRTLRARRPRLARRGRATRRVARRTIRRCARAPGREPEPDPPLAEAGA